MTTWDPLFKNYEDFPDGDSRVFNQVGGFLSTRPCVDHTFMKPTLYMFSLPTLTPVWRSFRDPSLHPAICPNILLAHLAFKTQLNCLFPGSISLPTNPIFPFCIVHVTFSFYSVDIRNIKYYWVPGTRDTVDSFSWIYYLLHFFPLLPSCLPILLTCRLR